MVICLVAIGPESSGSVIDILKAIPVAGAYEAVPGVPLLRTTVATPIAIARIGAILDDALAVRKVIHGVLVDILGLGVLITFRFFRFPDLTAEGSYPLGGAVAAAFLVAGTNPFVATLAAILAGKVPVDGRTVVMLTGGNVDPARFAEVLGEI